MEISLLGAASEPRALIRGKIQDIGLHGVCVLADHPITPPAVVACGVGVGRAPVAIPTLMEVRWSEQEPASGGYRLGLRFLLGSLTHLW